jgi:hypothetical protein
VHLEWKRNPTIPGKTAGMSEADEEECAPAGPTRKRPTLVNRMFTIRAKTRPQHEWGVQQPRRGLDRFQLDAMQV